MIDELPEFPPTLTGRERDSETKPSMTRDSRPAQESGGRDDRPAQSKKERDASASADTGQSDSADTDGSYTLANVPTGTRTVTVSASGYDSDSQQTVVSDGVASTLNFALTPATGGGTGTLKGTVKDSFGTKLSGVTVQVSGGPFATTNKGGKYTVQNVAEGSQSVTASKSGFVNAVEPVTITAEPVTVTAEPGTVTRGGVASTVAPFDLQPVATSPRLPPPLPSWQTRPRWGGAIPRGEQGGEP